jgi:hypothetical protein
MLVITKIREGRMGKPGWDGFWEMLGLLWLFDFFEGKDIGSSEDDGGDGG